ncbi:MAG: ABC transporter permease [Bacteroidota bacterium]
MLKNILTITRRSLIQNGAYTIINVVGLSIGIAVFLTIFTIIRYEYSFNTTHPYADRTFRMYSKFSGSIEGTNRGVSSALVPFMLDEITVDADLVTFVNLSTEVTISESNNTIKRLGRQRKRFWMIS